MSGIERLMTKRAALLRPSSSGTDPLNRPVTVWTPAGVSPCRLQKERATEVPTEAGKTEVADWLAFFPAASPVARNWRFTVDGTTYRALSVDTPTGRGGADHHKEVLARIAG